ncbi:MAG: Crp/Fnr family transcriptional regulator [Aureibaculum sp.]|jgi:CRP/FNR family transcriptional regulator
MVNEIHFLREKLDQQFTGVFEENLIDEIVKTGYLKHIDAGDLLVDIGDEMTHIPLIIKGLVKVIREDQNEEELLLYYLEKGDSCAISYVNCIHHSQSMFRAIADIDTECIMVPVNKIEEWLIKYETWRVFIIDSYHNRLLELVDTIESLAFLKLDERLYKYLKEQVNVTHNKILTITHHEIAQDLHTSRVVISRILKILENKGQIKLGRNRIKVKA